MVHCTYIIQYQSFKEKIIDQKQNHGPKNIKKILVAFDWKILWGGGGEKTQPWLWICRYHGVGSLRQFLSLHAVSWFTNTDVGVHAQHRELYNFTTRMCVLVILLFQLNVGNRFCVVKRTKKSVIWEPYRCTNRIQI